MRKLIVAVTLVGGLVAVSPSTALAATMQTVTGSGTGTVVLTFGVPTGSPPGALLTLTDDGTYTSSGALGAGSYHIDGFVFVGGPGVTFTGTAKLTRSDGATLSGAMTGTSDFLSTTVTYTLDLTSGTGQLVSATLSLSGAWTQFQGPPSGVQHGVDTFTLTGAVTANTTPPDKQACRKGGWRNFADVHGRPFRDQGQCVRWVANHPCRANSGEEPKRCQHNT